MFLNTTTDALNLLETLIQLRVTHYENSAED